MKENSVKVTVIEYIPLCLRCTKQNIYSLHEDNLDKIRLMFECLKFIWS